jgi:hypothetical protein
MPLPLAALVALSLGALFAHAARAALSQSDGSLWASRPTAIVAAFAAFVYLPALAYFTAFHGDWAYMYFVAWRRVPSAIDLAVVAGCAALVPAAFVLCAPFSRAQRRNVVVAMIATPAAAVAILAVVLQRRLVTTATFVQFSYGEGTRPAVASALGRAMLVAIVVCVAAAVWCARLLRTSQTSTAKKTPLARAPHQN